MFLIELLNKEIKKKARKRLILKSNLDTSVNKLN